MGTTSAGQASPGILSGKPAQAGLVLATLITGAIVANINTSISNVALPSIGRALQATNTELTGITDAYQLGIAATVLYLGAVGDRHGRRKLLLIGAALCVPFSLASVFATSALMLIIAQMLVGVSCGMLYPTTLSLISSLWSGVGKTKAIALWTGIGTGTSILGPILGGWMLGVFWWGSVFAITIPLAVLVFVAGFKLLPKSAGESDAPVDHPGGGLSVVMIACFVLSIVILPQGLTPVIWGLWAVVLVSGVLFVVRERKAPNPLFDFRAASIPTFWVAFVVGLIAFGALVGAMFIGQQFTQNVLGMDPLSAVLLTLGLAAGMFPSSVAAGRMIEARGTRTPFMIGLSVVVLGFLLMLFTWQVGTSLLWVVAAYLSIGIGIGMASTCAMRSLSMSLPLTKAGMSSGSADLTKDLGGAVFQAILGTLLAVAYSDYFSRAFAQLPTDQAQQLGNRAAQEIGSSYEGAEAVAKTLPGADATQLIAAANQAFTEGKSTAIAVATAAVLIAITLVWWKYPRVSDERRLFGGINAQNDQNAQITGDSGDPHDLANQ
ncbi:MAG: MFS transporter [Candidatus Nanopelagicales bacterium]|nr:MFS transporter [Candidatus Nanopelagicales bacterium]